MNWKTLKTAYGFICPWIRVRKDHVQLPSGVEMDDFYIVESANWVNVIVITEDNYIIMEEQYRHGIGHICFELPAGNVSDGENHLEAAKRELLEETGYAGGVWTAYGVSAPNASNMNNLCHTFLAKGVKKQAEPQLEVSEDIRIHFLTKNKIKDLLLTNSIIEGVVQAPLWKYLNENLN